MSISGLRIAIKTGLETISGLKAFSTVPDSIGQLPAAYVVPKTGTYDQAASGKVYQLGLEVVLLIRRVADVQQAQDELDPYVQPTGSKSVKAAIQAANYSSHADTLRVSGFRDYGGLEFGGQLYIGAKFDLEVVIS